MPRSKVGPLFAVALVLALAAWAAGDVEVAAGISICVGDDKGQNHVNFVDRGDGHIDFCIDPDVCGGNRGEGHVDFRIDPSGGYVIDAELSPGGVLLCGGTDQDAAFRVACRDDGVVEVNGEKLAACDPGLGARITVAWGAGTVAVAAVDAEGVLRAARYALDFAPETVTATGVCSLSIARQ